MKSIVKIYKKENLKLITNYKDILFTLISILGLVMSNMQLIEMIKVSKRNLFEAIIYYIVICSSIIFLNIYNFENRKNTCKIQNDNKTLEEKNRNLLEITDNIRCFKHDFNNIIQAIDGYIYLEDMKSLQVYFKSLLGECNHIKVVDSINCQVIDNPAISGVLLSKYRLAEENKIQMNIEFMAGLKELEEKSYVVSRILGILLDNAVEATNECEEKIINFEVTKDIKVNKLVMKIENSYSNKEIDTSKIFEKNYTTKKDKGNSGLGRWKIHDILRKDTSLELFTTKDNEFFKQRLEIYLNNK